MFYVNEDTKTSHCSTEGILLALNKKKHVLNTCLKCLKIVVVNLNHDYTTNFNDNFKNCNNIIVFSATPFLVFKSIRFTFRILFLYNLFKLKIF